MANLYLFLIISTYLITSIPHIKGSIFDEEISTKVTIYDEKGHYSYQRNQVECVEETRVEPDLVLRTKIGDWNINNIDLKKWALCILNKSGVMSRQGVFKMDVAMYKIPKGDQTQLESQIDACLSKKALPPYQIAWLFVRCYKNTKPKPKYNLF